MHLERLFQRLFPVSQTRAKRRAQRQRPTGSEGRRLTRIESLEDRRVLAVLYVANDSGFTDAAHPGSPQAGDTVTWNGGGQFTAPVSGLTFGTNAFDSINAAIADANSGDTIDVAPGTFSEQVNVNKSITLLGAQNGVDAQTGRTGASETILDTTANGGKTQLVIGADDVTIDGFTVQNETNSNLFGAAIYIQPGHHGTHIVNDIVQNNQIGLYLANDSSTDQTVVQHDLFQNNNQTGPGSGNGIYLDQFTAGGAVTNVLIDSNTFTNNSAAGVGLSSTSSTAATSNVTISNNVFDSNGDGIYAFETQNSQITNNTIENSAHSGIGLYGDDSGINISGNNITNSDTANNGSAGIRIGSYNDTTPNSNITITGNGITSTTGNNLQLDPSTASGAMAAAYTGTLNASLNYWGTTDEASIASKISDPNTQVAFSPYLNNGNQNTNPNTPGFQADLTHVTATSAGAQIGSVGAIQAAVNAAPSGGTVTILPGTYDEEVTINKPLTLLGAQAGVDATTGRSGASESIVDGKDLGGGQRSTAFYVTANDVTIDGFTIQNTNSVNQFGAGIVLGAGTSGAHIVNDIFSNNLVGLFLANASTTDQAVVQHDLFENNNQTGAAGGTAIYTDQYVAGGALNDVLIDSNKITGNANGGIGISPTDTTKPASNITISNNTIDSNGRGIYLFDTLNSTISGNDITNDTTPTDGGTSVGIGIDGDVNGLTITGNNIHNGAGNGIHITNANVNANQNVTINDNSISGFTGQSVLVDTGGYTGTLDATKNWWGTNDAATINGQISGNVAFSPYLDSGTNSITTGPGFQGDLTHLDVTSLGQQLGTVGPIEQAIQAAPAGGTVTIQAGTYTEDDVVIDKNLTLQANGKVILQAPTTSTGTGITITNNPQTVTIVGFEIDSFGVGLSSTGGGTLNLIDLDLNVSASAIIGIGVVSAPAPIANVQNLNLINTAASPQTVSVEAANTILPPPFGPSAGGVVTLFPGDEPVGFSNVANLSITTGSGSDTFNIIPRTDTTITIDGGNPTPPANPGDTLNMNVAGTTGANLMVTQDASGFSGSWTFTNAKPVNFSHIETLTPNTVTASGAGQTITATEGVATGSQVVATFTDQANLPLADYSADINWGDGTNSAGTVTFDANSGVYSVSGNHTYAEDGSDQIAVTVHRTGAPDVTLNGTATVVEPPLVQLFPPVVAPVGHEGSPITVDVGFFTHGNNTEPVSGFSATINWGDGTTSVGQVEGGNGSSYVVSGTHTYQDEGTFTVSGTVTDTSGGVSMNLGAVVGIHEALLPDGTDGTANQRFISELYSDLLHRGVDANGLAFWSAQLDGGATRAQIAAGIENSDEYRHVEIDSLFEHYLHRHVDPSGLSTFNDALKNGATDEQVAAAIVGSDEYFALNGSTNDGFLNALFEDALNRPIEPAAKTAFEQFLAGGMTREQAAMFVFNSPEYHNDLVAQIYLDALDRPVDADGQSYWAGKLAGGQTDEQVLAAIAGSDEYFAKTSA